MLLNYLYDATNAMERMAHPSGMKERKEEKEKEKKEEKAGWNLRYNENPYEWVSTRVRVQSLLGTGTIRFGCGYESIRARVQNLKYDWSEKNMIMKSPRG